MILRRRRRRTGLAVVGVSLVSIAVLIGGLSLLWLFASQRTAAVMDEWIAREAKHGRIFTCPDRAIGGFPLGIEVSCAHPTFRGKIGGAILEGSLGGLRAETYLYEPNAVDVVAAGPAEVHRATDEADTPPAEASAIDTLENKLAWDDLHLNLRILGPELGRIALDIDHPKLTRADGQDAKADHFELHVGPAAGRPLDDHADDLWFRLSRATIPALDAFTGTSEPLDADEKAVLDRLAIGDIEPGPLMAEAWRQARGTVQLSVLTLAKGSLHATASGTLALDDQHRLAGRLQAGLSGFEPIAQRYGLSLRAVAAGGILAKLLDRSAGPAADNPAGQEALTLPFVFVDGHLSIGPIRTGLRLAPLY